MPTKQDEKPSLPQENTGTENNITETLALTETEADTAEHAVSAGTGTGAGSPRTVGKRTSRYERLLKRLGGKGAAMMAVICVAVLALCLAAGLDSGTATPTAPPVFTENPPATAEPTPEPTPEPPPAPTPAPTPEPTPEPTPAPTPPPVTYDFAAPVPEREAVENDYFSDAVFIGDSRTDGLRLYSGIKGSHFLYYTGVTVFDVASRSSKLLEQDGEKISFLEALEKQKYAKIYIMLGINELGYPDGSAFQRVYGQLIDKLREIQPEAVIYVQSLIPVNEERCKSYGQPSYITNKKIAGFTDLLVELAEEKRVAYVNVAAGLADENGALPADKTSDGIHFKRAGYEEWLEYLKTHTVDEDAYWAGQEVVGEETEGEGAT